jgi:hypothetical protein
MLYIFDHYLIGFHTLLFPLSEGPWVVKCLWSLTTDHKHNITTLIWIPDRIPISSFILSRYLFPRQRVSYVSLPSHIRGSHMSVSLPIWQRVLLVSFPSHIRGSHMSVGLPMTEGFTCQLYITFHVLLSFICMPLFSSMYIRNLIKFSQRLPSFAMII